MATLVAENLTFAYAKKSKPVLNKVSVEIKPGTLTALVGPNGAGKSTLLRILQGQNTPDKGEIKIDGENLYKSRALVALMPQRSSMNWKFPITVEKLVSLGQIKYSKSRSNTCIVLSYCKACFNDVNNLSKANCKFKPGIC